MKKYLFSILILLAVLMIFPLSTITANAQNRVIQMTIDGDTYIQNIEIEENVFLRVGGSFYEYVQSKLYEGLDGVDILNSISNSLGTAYFNELSKREKQPVNATLKVDADKRKFDYISGKVGFVFDRVEASLALAKALDGDNSKLELREKSPDVTVSNLKERTKLLGSYTTSLLNSPSTRKHNVVLAGKFLNGVVVSPNEKFSFNEVVGERTQERGFEPAKVISNGEYIDGIGGGVCQLATTLYNAVLLSGLKVTSVARHSYPPSYVDPSRDAMVSSYSDFCFENISSEDVYLFVNVTENSVTVSIYGKDAGRFSVLSKTKSKTPAKAVDKFGKELTNLDGYSLVSAGIDGVNSELFLIFPNGKIVKIREDTYNVKNSIYQK